MIYVIGQYFFQAPLLASNLHFLERRKIMKPLVELTITIHLLTGEPIVFKIDAEFEKLKNAATRIESSLNSNYVGVELDEKLIIIPTHNIQTIEISPAPFDLIAHVITDAKPAS
jgi:hypothetical protein